VVDVDVAGFERVRRGVRVPARRREHVGRQTVRQRVGAADDVVEVVEAREGRDRAEGLGGHQHRVVGQSGDDGWREEVAAIGQPLAAELDARAAPVRVVDELLHRRHAPLVRERTHARALVESGADLHLARLLEEAGEEAVVDLLVQIEARGRHADLPRVAELEGLQQVGGALDVGVFEDEDRRMPAQLHRRALHVLRRERGELLAHRHRSGERNLAHDRRADQVVGDLVRHAPDDVQAPGRQACIVKDARERDDRARRVFGPLEHERAARAERRADLADRLAGREVPRREGRAHAYRLAHDELAHRRVARRNHAPVDAPAFLGMPFGVLGAVLHLVDRLGERLALVQRDVAADPGRALAQQVGGLAKDAAAFERRGVAPGGERALRGGERAIEIFARGVRQLADHLAGGRIEDVLLAAALRRDEFAIDVETEILVHGAHHLAGS